HRGRTAEVALVPHAERVLASFRGIEEQHLAPDFRLRVSRGRGARDDREDDLLTLDAAAFSQDMRGERDLRDDNVALVAPGIGKAGHEKLDEHRPRLRATA